MIQGRPEEAILPYLEKAIRLDPRAHNIFIAYYTLGRCHLFLGRIGADPRTLRIVSKE